MPGRTALVSECVLSHTEGPRPVLGLSSPQTGIVSNLEDYESLGQDPGRDHGWCWSLGKILSGYQKGCPLPAGQRASFLFPSAEKALVYSG